MVFQGGCEKVVNLACLMSCTAGIVQFQKIQTLSTNRQKMGSIARAVTHKNQVNMGKSLKIGYSSSGKYRPN